MRIRVWILAACVLGVSACAPKVGSDAWCKKLEKTPRGEWTIDETGQYAKYCVLRLKPDDDSDSH